MTDVTRTTTDETTVEAADKRETERIHRFHRVYPNVRIVKRRSESRVSAPSPPAETPYDPSAVFIPHCSMHVFSSSDVTMMKDLTLQRILHNTLIEIQSALLQSSQSESKDEAEKIIDGELRKLVDNSHVTSDKYTTAYKQLADKLTSDLKELISQRSEENKMTFWQWTTQQRPLWHKNIDEAIITVVLFVVTLRISAFITSLIAAYLFGIHGTLVDGPNSFRVLSLLCISPVYAVLLAIIGTLGGRHVYFAGMSMKILNRFVPKTVLNRVICAPAKRKASQ